MRTEVGHGLSTSNSVRVRDRRAVTHLACVPTRPLKGRVKNSAPVSYTSRLCTTAA